MFSTRTKTASTVKVLKIDAASIGKMLIALQTHEGNLDDFFASEIQSYATSLSDLWKLHFSKKSEIVELISPENIGPVLPDQFDGKILDGPAIIHMLQKGSATTFAKYSSLVFIPYIEQSLEAVDRLDIVWDTYREDSLKAATREK